MKGKEPGISRDSSRTSSPDGEPAIAAAKVIPTPLPFEADRVAMHCPEL